MSLQNLQRFLYLWLSLLGSGPQAIKTRHQHNKIDLMDQAIKVSYRFF